MDRSELLGILSQVPDEPAQEAPKLSWQEEVNGPARAYLQGLLFGFADEIQAGIQTGKLPFMSSGLWGNYDQQVAQIRQEQERYRQARPEVAYPAEFIGGMLLNPFGKIKQGTSLLRLAAEGALAGYGESEAKTTGRALIDTGIGGLTSLVGGKAINKAGDIFANAGKEAQRLLTSAYKILPSDLAKASRKVGRKGRLYEGVDPLVATLREANRNGIISPDLDPAENAGRIIALQNRTYQAIDPILKQTDDALSEYAGTINRAGIIDQFADFDTPLTDAWIATRKGGEKRDLLQALAEEKAFLLEDLTELGGPTLQNLQKLKQGLNYKYDKNPYKADVVKMLRSDIRQMIENRIDEAATLGVIPEDLAGQVKILNQGFGDLKELSDIFLKQVPKEMRGDILEDLFHKFAATTGGQGSFNIMSAATGNPLWSVAATGVNLARSSKSKAAAARGFDWIDRYIDQIPGMQAFGRFLTGEATIPASRFMDASRVPAPITGRTLQTAIDAGQQMFTPKDENGAAYVPKYSQSELLDILSSVGGESKKKMKPDSEIDPLIKDVAAEVGIRPELFESLVIQESMKNPNAVGPQTKYGKAKGLTQLLESTAAEVANRQGLNDFDIMDPWTNLLLGASYLKDLLNKYGDEGLALTAYHTGPGNVDKYLNRTGGSSLDDILNELGPVGKVYASTILGRINSG